MMGFSDLYEMYEDFKLERAETNPADFESHLEEVRMVEDLIGFRDWVRDSYPDVHREFYA